jgi:hypothetical protein
VYAANIHFPVALKEQLPKDVKVLERVCVCALSAMRKSFTLTKFLLISRSSLCKKLNFVFIKSFLVLC